MSIFSTRKKDTDGSGLNNSKKLDKWAGAEDYCLPSTIWVSRDPWQEDGCNMAQHTPKKLSKIELTSPTSALLHETSTSAYELESNEEDYFIDFEGVQMSQDHGSRIENKTTAVNTSPISLCQKSGILHNTVHTTLCSSRNSASTIPSEKDTAKCANLVPETSASENHNNLSDYLCPREPCTQSIYSHQPIFCSVSGFSKSTNQENHLDTCTQLDPSADQGYCSHSTVSSYQGQDSQKEGSQMDLGTQEKGWSARNRSVDDNCLNGENELEDLLYHFQNFFHDRFETEFHRYREAVYGILQEQQNHVRQIVHTAVREQYSSQRSYTEDLLSEDAKKTPGVSNSTSQSDISFTQMLDTDFYIPLSLPSVPLSNSSSAVKEETVKKRLLDLYSLSCSVSTLLAKKQFKS